MPARSPGRTCARPGSARSEQPAETAPDSGGGGEQFGGLGLDDVEMKTSWERSRSWARVSCSTSPSAITRLARARISSGPAWSPRPTISSKARAGTGSRRPARSTARPRSGGRRPGRGAVARNPTTVVVQQGLAVWMNSDWPRRASGRPRRGRRPARGGDRQQGPQASLAEPAIRVVGQAPGSPARDCPLVCRRIRASRPRRRCPGARASAARRATAVFSATAEWVATAKLTSSFTGTGTAESGRLRRCGRDNGATAIGHAIQARPPLYVVRTGNRGSPMIGRKPLEDGVLDTAGSRLPCQPARGYRAGLDAALLAAACRRRGPVSG